MRRVLAAIGLLVVLTSAAVEAQTFRRSAPAPLREAPAADRPSPAAREAGAERSEEPRLEIEFPHTEAVPGQPLFLRLTVLAPSFMPQPPRWPDFETPDVRVRLPSRATSPASRQIDGETWSGVTRRYALTPLVAGAFSIPPQEVQVTWAAPAGGDPRVAILRTETIAFAGVRPDGAEGLDPFLAARAVELSQTVDGTPEALKPGDGIERVVVARIDGAPPMMLPPLLRAATTEGLAAYPDAPALEETEDRGEASGTRTERVVYAAEGGGEGELPEVRFDWFNLETGRVETASLEGVPYAVSGPPAASATSSAAPWDLARMARLAGGAAVAIIAAAALVRYGLPALRRHRDLRHMACLASEPHAWRRLRAAVSAKDAAALPAALELWTRRLAGPDPRADAGVRAALLSLGEARFGRAADAVAASPAASWADLSDALSSLRRRLRASQPTSALPPLNPED